MSSLESLPQLPLSVVLNKLGRKDAKACRLVNQYLKSRTEDLYTHWRLRIEEQTEEYLPRLLSLKVKDVKISQQWNRDTSKSLSLRMPEGGIFKYPDMIQSLECEDFGLSFIKPEDLAFLLATSKNLQTLKLNLPCFTIESDVFANVSYNFPHRTLDIHMDTYYKRNINPGTLIHQFLLHSEMPKLISISLGLGSIDQNSQNSVSTLAGALFSFIHRHGKILREVMFGIMEQNNPSNELVNFKNTCTTLDSLHLLNYGRIPLSNTWEKLIQAQTVLTTLEICCEMSVSKLYNKLLPHIHQTLKNLGLGGLKLDTGPVRSVPNSTNNNIIHDLDLYPFRICSKLEKLQLEVSREPYSKIINIASLPQAIEEVCIHTLHIEEEDLLNLCTNRPKLATFAFGRLKDVLPNGLRGEVLKQLMATNLTQIRFLSGVISKNMDLLEICKTTTYEDEVFDGNGFTLERASKAEDKWKCFNFWWD